MPGDVHLTRRRIRLELAHAWTISRGTARYKDNVLVTVSQDGISGFGEAAPNSRYGETAASTEAFIEAARPLFKNIPLRQYRELQSAVAGLQAGQTAAKAALDMAVMDWMGKSLNIPLYRFWGLNPALTPLTTYSIGIDTPEAMQHKVREASGFPIYKIKVGKDNVRRIVTAIRAVSGNPLRIDANEAWTDLQIARDEINWLQEQGVEFVEQPMPADMLEETARLREQVALPLIADESVKTADQIYSLREAYDGINIKVMKSGGLQEALRMIEIGRTLGMKIMIGCMVETSLAISAAAALSPLADYADLDGHLLIKNDPVSGISVKNGEITLTDLPGIGLVKEP